VGASTPAAPRGRDKNTVGQTPSGFRDRPQWQAWYAVYERLSELRSVHMKPTYQAENVRIVDVQEIRVGVLEHRGDPKLLGDTIRRFIEWRKQNHLAPEVSATFNLFYGDPNETPPEDFRMDLCAAITRPVADNPQGVVERTIPAGRCAVLRHVGSDDTLGESLKYLYAAWLPASGEEPRDFPLYVQRVNLFPDVLEHEAIVDVFLPLR
jgi:AraC family transcriptional regulator